MNRLTPTIFALSSGAPPAAIAVIRISGPSAHAAAEQLCGKLPVSRQASLRTLRDAAGETLDDALVIRFDGPATATGEDLVEVHCHGGRAVVRAVLHALGRIEDVREARPGEFTRRAFENGRIDLTQAEGLADLLEAETESQRVAALAISEGAIRRQVEQWRQRLLGLSAQAEAAIDYADEESETDVAAAELADAASQLGAEIQRWLEKPRSEPLRRGLRVVLAGPPNTGKSSLLNRLTGVDKAIVSPEAGTTRDVIEVPISIAGLPFVFIDTAGVREGTQGVERSGIVRAEQQAAAADLLLWLGDPETAPRRGNLVLVHGRADLPERGQAPDGSLAVSAMTGQGIENLTARIIEMAKVLLPRSGDIPLNDRQAEALTEVSDAFALISSQRIELTAEALRQARSSLDRVTGRTGVEDVMDQLFGRFCLGK